MRCFPAIFSQEHVLIPRGSCVRVHATCYSTFAQMISTLVNFLNNWVCYPPLFRLIGYPNFELGTLHFEKKPNWVFMNFQLGIFSKGYNDDAQIHKNFTYQTS